MDIATLILFKSVTVKLLYFSLSQEVVRVYWSATTPLMQNRWKLAVWHIFASLEDDILAHTPENVFSPHYGEIM